MSTATQAKLQVPAVVVSGENLRTGDVVQVARDGAPVELTRDEAVLGRVRASCDFVSAVVREGRAVYGITSAFGGMGNVSVPKEQAALLQRSSVWAHKTGVGAPLPLEYVRGAMVLRVNSHLRGASGIRLELIERMVDFLNANVTPLVPELGSIGASGDLVPLSYITGAIIGLDECCRVSFDGEQMGAPAALKRMHLPKLSLRPKEALAMMNGTSLSTAMAACCVYDASELFSIVLGFHALAIQALRGGTQSFEPFIHQMKPHRGQRWVADSMVRLLAGSGMTLDESKGEYGGRRGDLIQDRYSMRCLPQFLGPVADTIEQVCEQVEVEMNSATDNPLIDGDAEISYHGGNFLGQYIATGMDRLRQSLGLCAAHIDTQIALLMTPEFSNGLPPSLVGNQDRPTNVGMKALQIAGNSIMPLLTFYGAPIADRFPTHAEQFNQNINSQSFNSAKLGRTSIELFQRYLALALLAAVQASDLRSMLVRGGCDARGMLSPPTRSLYETVKDLVGRPPDDSRPYIWNDDEQALDAHIESVFADLSGGGRIAAVLADFRPDSEMME